MIIRNVENNLNFTKLKTTNLSHDENNVDNNDSSNKKVFATLVGLSVLGITLVHLAKKPKILPKRWTEVVAPDKRLLLELTKIKKIIQDASRNNKDVDPSSILQALQESKLISGLKEIDFIVRENSKITAGRKFSFVYTSSVTKKRYNMIFEVHDYCEKGNKRNWVMRLYDLDFKNHRSYLTDTGGLKTDSYLSTATHINCGEYGRNFVFGNEKI